MNLNEDILYLLADSIEESLNKKGIMVQETPSYSRDEKSIHKYAGFQDEVAIQKKLSSYRVDPKSWHTERRTEYDTKSLAAIGMLREGEHPTKIERCKAILITQDYLLIRCMSELYPDIFKHEIPFSMLDIDIASLLWLRNYNPENSLPKDLLVASAKTACNVSHDVMQRAIEVANELEINNQIPEEAALLIRSQPAIKKYVFEATKNDVDAVNKESLIQALDNYIKKQAEPAIEETKNRIDGIWKQKFDEREKTVNAIINIKETDLREKENTIKKLRDALRDSETEKIDFIEKESKKPALFIGKLVRYTLLFIFITLIIWNITSALISNFKEFNIIFVILGLISIYQLVDYIVKWTDIIRKLEKMISNFIYMKVYTKKIEDYKKHKKAS